MRKTEQQLQTLEETFWAVSVSGTTAGAARAFTRPGTAASVVVVCGRPAGA